MKRSEMVGFIEDTLTYFSHRVSPFTVKDIAMEILKEIEKRGMLPSYRPSDEKTIRCQVSEWEPELANKGDGNG